MKYKVAYFNCNTNFSKITQRAQKDLSKSFCIWEATLKHDLEIDLQIIFQGNSKLKPVFYRNSIFNVEIHRAGSSNKSGWTFKGYFFIIYFGLKIKLKYMIIICMYNSIDMIPHKNVEFSTLINCFVKK